MVRVIGPIWRVLRRSEVIALLLLALLVRGCHLSNLANDFRHRYALTIPRQLGLFESLGSVNPGRIEALVLTDGTAFRVEAGYPFGLDTYPDGAIGFFTVFPGRRSVSGVWAPTLTERTISVSYTPVEALTTLPGALASPVGHSPSPVGNTRDELEGVIAQLEGVIEQEAWFEYTPPAGIDHAIRPGSYFGTSFPSHDLGRDMNANDITVLRRVLWLGYIENVATLGVLALLVYHARRTWIVKPWRDWNREPWQCRACRYDRRSTPDGAPCPECGDAPATP
ncbi:MAG: hypothetical protein AAGH64_02005 [Planctomycetota bacterium]